MEANKAVKIGEHKQDVADMSQVGSNDCPQAKIVIVSLHAREMRTSDHRENKQQINMATFRTTDGIEVGVATSTIMRQFSARYACL
jgi:hypothetical protein